MKTKFRRISRALITLPKRRYISHVCRIVFKRCEVSPSSPRHVRSQVTDIEDEQQIWRAAANMLNKRLRTAEEE
jgi:hypothetical protein